MPVLKIKNNGVWEEISGGVAAEIDDVITIDLDDTVSGTSNPINADTLGGRSADEFVLISDIENLPTESYDDTELRGLISENSTEIENLKNMPIIPAVSSEDNGKFLRVVNGAWAAVELPNAKEATF